MEKKKLCCAVIFIMLPLFASAEGSPSYDDVQNEKAYFLSSSIPEKTLVALMQSAEKNQVPVYFRGLVSDSMEKTAKYIQYLSSKYGVSGVQIDPCVSRSIKLIMYQPTWKNVERSLMWYSGTYQLKIVR